MIPRLLEPIILKTIKKLNKLILIYGPRQAGKTTLLKSLQSKLKKDYRVLYLNCDLEENLASINTTALTLLAQLIKNVDILLIDEAQRLDNPGLTLKIIHDNFPKLKTIATGSSSFSLKNQVSDALTGRFWDFTLYPLSWSEIINWQKLNANLAIKKRQADTFLDKLLLYGFYPEIWQQSLASNKQLFLQKIVDSYLFQDILTFQKVRRSQAIINLTRALAYQIGSEINENELSKRIKVDRKTVVSYLDILEQSFVIIKVHPFSKNPRREIGRNYKVYFVDLGIRNALIGDFNPLKIRPDVGSLWENFVIIERLKKFSNQSIRIDYNFWRSYSGAEVDWLEQEANKTLQAFECKFSKQALSKGAGIFSKKYQAPVKIINKHNYQKFF